MGRHLYLYACLFLVCIACASVHAHAQTHTDAHKAHTDAHSHGHVDTSDYTYVEHDIAPYSDVEEDVLFFADDVHVSPYQRLLNLLNGDEELNETELVRSLHRWRDMQRADILEKSAGPHMLLARIHACEMRHTENASALPDEYVYYPFVQGAMGAAIDSPTVYVWGNLFGDTRTFKDTLRNAHDAQCIDDHLNIQRSCVFVFIGELVRVGDVSSSAAMSLLHAIASLKVQNPDLVFVTHSPSFDYERCQNKAHLPTYLQSLHMEVQLALPAALYFGIADAQQHVHFIQFSHGVFEHGFNVDDAISRLLFSVKRNYMLRRGGMRGSTSTSPLFVEYMPVYPVNRRAAAQRVFESKHTMAHVDMALQAILNGTDEGNVSTPYVCANAGVPNKVDLFAKTDVELNHAYEGHLSLVSVVRDAHPFTRNRCGGYTYTRDALQAMMEDYRGESYSVFGFIHAGSYDHRGNLPMLQIINHNRGFVEFYRYGLWKQVKIERKENKKQSETVQPPQFEAPPRPNVKEPPPFVGVLWSRVQALEGGHFDSVLVLKFAPEISDWRAVHEYHHREAGDADRFIRAYYPLSSIEVAPREVSQFAAVPLRVQEEDAERAKREQEQPASQENVAPDGAKTDTSEGQIEGTAPTSEPVQVATPPAPEYGVGEEIQYGDDIKDEL